MSNQNNIWWEYRPHIRGMKVENYFFPESIGPLVSYRPAYKKQNAESPKVYRAFFYFRHTLRSQWEMKL